MGVTRWRTGGLGTEDGAARTRGAEAESPGPDWRTGCGGPRRQVFFGVLFAPRGSSRPRHGSSLPVPATAPSLPAAQLP